MTTWTYDELTKIDSVDELHISTEREDGTMRKPVIIWSVRIADDLFVRAVRGVDGLWYKHATETGLGAISAGGVEKETSFTPELDDEINLLIDDAFRTKYSRYTQNIIDTTLTDNARAATLRVTPR